MSKTPKDNALALARRYADGGRVGYQDGGVPGAEPVEQSPSFQIRQNGDGTVSPAEFEEAVQQAT